MSENLEIKITTPAETSGLQKADDGIKNLGETAKKTGGETGQLDSVIKRAAVGLNKLGNEIPVVGYALNALKNPFTIVAAAAVIGIAKFKEYSDELKQMVSNTDHAARQIKISATSYSDAAIAVAAMAAAMKDLRDATKNVTDNIDINIGRLDEQFAATERLIEAEAELEKAKLDRDEVDPVKRARGKEAIDNRLAETKLGLAGKKGQQADLVDKQRLKERQFQADVVAKVPSRESLVANVSAFETDRVALEEAKNANRQSFGKAELLRRFVRDGNEPGWHKEFAPSDVRELKKLGLAPGLSEVGDSGVFFDGGIQEPATLQAANASGREHLAGAERERAGTRDRLARAQSSFNYSRGSLLKGVAQLSDIDPFLNKAETEAAGFANESYQREESLMLRRDLLLRGQQNDIAVGSLQAQTTGAKGQLSVREAEAAADKAAETFGRLAARLGQRLEAIERHQGIQSQQTGRGF